MKRPQKIHRSIRPESPLDADPLWYRDAILYETHVRAFFDSNGDGIGDFPGLTEKLDYLRDLGITAIWLLPHYPSPLKDDGYDIADYTAVHPAYGTLADFRVFLREAHRRGLRVITELVLNHTSDQHPWFQRARRSPAGSAHRNYYVWSETPAKYSDARIIFKDFEPSNWSWDPIAGAYYWHRFYSHQPDLNFQSPDVHRELFRALDFWLQLGVDGMRLDAIPYLYEGEGTTCENLPDTHRFLKTLRRHVDRHYPGLMFLAEANQWPEDAAAYFGDGDECHVAFHFPLMPRMFMALRMEDRFPIVDILKQTPPIPENAQWALFLRNHDELTLEMVTDEERDYMYRVYGEERQMRINLGIRRRLAPLLENDRRKSELLHGLLLSLPGTPVLYYGDEIGMGDNIYLGDRNGVRTPMQWSADRNAGFSRASPQRLYLPIVTDTEYHFQAVNVEVEQKNLSSPLWWTKRILTLRKSSRVFGRGTLQFLHPENRKILAFTRSFGEEILLVVANLSRFTQHTALDLAAHAGRVPIEMFGHTEFPPVGASPYVLTLGPHHFIWFSLEKPAATAVRDAAAEREIPVVAVSGPRDELFLGSSRASLEHALPDYLRQRRWFAGKARRIKKAEFAEIIPFGAESGGAWWTFVRVLYVEGDPQIYLLPLSLLTGEAAGAFPHDVPRTVLARIREPGDGAGSDREALLVDALFDPGFADALLEAFSRRRRWKTANGEIVASRTRALRSQCSAGSLTPVPLKGEQSNSSVVYGDRWIAKLVRRPEPGVNPDAEIGRFLTEQAKFRSVPTFAGSIELHPSGGEPTTLALLHGFVRNHGDAWRYTLDALGRYFERMLGKRAELAQLPVPEGSLLAQAGTDPSAEVREAIGTYLPSAELLGTRTGELHLALASDAEDPSFAPEPFSMLTQRSSYQSRHTLVERTLELLRGKVSSLPPPARDAARKVLASETAIRAKMRSFLSGKIDGQRIRIHGDYHLGQVLFTGKDFVVIDFEGEPARVLSTRRLKRSPMVDVAGMLRSFDYAANAVLTGHTESARIRPEDREALGPWGHFWTRWVSATFLRSYLETALRGSFLPRDPAQLAVLIEVDLLEKAIYEIAYELQNRPDWVGVPLAGLLEVLAHGGSGPEGEKA